MKTEIIHAGKGKKPRRKQKFKFPLDDRLLSGYPDGIINPFTQKELFENICKKIDQEGKEFSKDTIEEIKYLKEFDKNIHALFGVWKVANNYFKGAKCLRVKGAETINYYINAHPRFSTLKLAKLTVPKPEHPNVRRIYDHNTYFKIMDTPDCFNLSILIDKMQTLPNDMYSYRTHGYILPLSIYDSRIPKDDPDKTKNYFGHLFKVELGPKPYVGYHSGYESKKEYLEKIDYEVFGLVKIYM